MDIQLLKIWFIISLLIQLLLIIMLFREFYIKRVHLVLALIGAFSLSFVSDGFGFLSDRIQNEVTSAIVSVPEIITVLLSTFLFYIFFVLFERSSGNFKESVLFTFSLGTLIGVTLTIPFLSFVDLSNMLETIEIFPSFALVNFIVLGLLFAFVTIVSLVIWLIIVPIKIITIIFKTRRNLDILEESQEYNGILIGFLFYFFATLSDGIVVLFSLPEISFVLIHFLQIIGQLLILRTFIMGKSFIFTAHRLDNLILINEGGLVLMNHEFSGSKTRVNEILIGAILNAISQSLEEIIGATKKLEKIQLGDLQITFRAVNEGHIFLLITERTSQFIAQVLDSFVLEFGKLYKSKLNNDRIVNPIDFEGTSDLVTKYFAIKGFHKTVSGSIRLPKINPKEVPSE